MLVAHFHFGGRCDEAISVSSPKKVSFSPLVAAITDKFGVRWGLMVDESVAEW